jgi:hypothetical protein
MDASPGKKRNAKFSASGGGEAKERERGWEGLEARGGIEPPIKVLQTFALPLGDRADENKS